jgi:hypothetical protein
VLLKPTSACSDVTHQSQCGFVADWHCCTYLYPVSPRLCLSTGVEAAPQSVLHRLLEITSGIASGCMRAAWLPCRCLLLHCFYHVVQAPQSEFQCCTYMQYASELRSCCFKLYSISYCNSAHNVVRATPYIATLNGIQQQFCYTTRCSVAHMLLCAAGVLHRTVWIHSLVQCGGACCSRAVNHDTHHGKFDVLR